MPVILIDNLDPAQVRNQADLQIFLGALKAKVVPFARSFPMPGRDEAGSLYLQGGGGK